MGRRTVTTLPNNAHTYVSYLLTGEPSTNWGDRTYPVAYGYDSLGQVTNAESMSVVENWCSALL